MFINDVDFAPVAFYLIPKIFVRKYFIVSNDCVSKSCLQCALHFGLFMHISCSNPWSWDKLILFLHIIFQPSSGENTYSYHQAFTQSFLYIFCFLIVRISRLQNHSNKAIIHLSESTNQY